MGGCCRACEEGRRAEEKRGEVETNLAAGAMGHRRGREEEGQAMLDPAATECDGSTKAHRKTGKR